MADDPKRGDILWLKVPFRCEWGPGTREGILRFKFQDTVVDVKMADGKSVGSISGCFGGDLEVHIASDKGRVGEIWALSSRELWNLVVAARDREDLVVPMAAKRGKDAVSHDAGEGERDENG